MNNPIHFEKAEIWLENGILFWKTINVDMAHSLKVDSVVPYIDAMYKLSGGKPTPIVIDARNVKGTYTIEAAKLFANSPMINKIKLAEAFVINSMSAKLLIASYKRIYDSQTPFIIVNNLERAIAYCTEIKKTYDANN